MFSFFRSVDPQDLELRSDRLRRTRPWVKTPFKKDFDNSQEFKWTGHEQPKLDDCVRHPHSFLWTDLMLDLAMAAAFANLTGNTKIQSATAAVSYVSFFALVFWIWTSICLYNIRYRQDDWLHRFYAFLQLGVYAGLSAFTADFDLSTGIIADPDDALLISSRERDGFSSNQIRAEKARLDRIPLLNFRGVALVMAIRSLLLLIPYCIVYYQAGKFRKNVLLVPVITTSISTLFYLISFGMLMAKAAAADVTKLPLWYLPIVIEGSGLYIETFFSDHVGYRGELIWERYSTILAVIIGEGLNAITGTFRYLVGSVGFDATSAGALVSACVIVFFLWASYFETSTTLVPGSRRALTWGYLHFFYFTAIILTLEAMNSILVQNNLDNALIEVSESLTSLGNIDVTQLSGVQSLQSVNKTLEKIGVSLDAELDYLKAITNDPSYNQTYIDGASLQWLMQIWYTIYKQFDAAPDEDSVEYADISDFVFAEPDNTTTVSPGRFIAIDKSIRTPLESSALWYCGSAGGILIFLAILNQVQRPAKDRFAWASIATRALTGTAFALLSIMNKGGLNYDSKLVTFLASGWMLPSFAITLLVQSAIDYILLYLAKRAYRGKEFMPLHHPSDTIDNSFLKEYHAQGRYISESSTITSNEHKLHQRPVVYYDPVSV